MEKLVEEFAKAIPSLVIASPLATALIIIVWMVLKNGGSDFLKSFKPKGRYVEQERFHSHIDELKNMIKEELERFGESIDKQLEGIRGNVNILLKAGLK
jgi:hypothetical protein